MKEQQQAVAPPLGQSLIAVGKKPKQEWAISRKDDRGISEEGVGRDKLIANPGSWIAQ